MNIFNLSKIIYDLVFLDGPHTTKDILREALWFAERSRKGSRIISMILTCVLDIRAATYIGILKFTKRKT